MTRTGIISLIFIIPAAFLLALIEKNKWIENDFLFFLFFLVYFIVTSFIARKLGKGK